MQSDLYYMKRSIPMAIIFSIITCGIYAYYWLYQLMSSLYHLTGRRNTAGMDLVLSLVTCGIYLIYLGYKIGKLESEAYDIYKLRQKDDAILYLILNIFSLALVTYAIVQSNINHLVENGEFSGTSEGSPGGDSHNWNDRAN